MSDNPRQKSAPPEGSIPSRTLASGSDGLRKLGRARGPVATIPPLEPRGVLVVEDDPDLQWRLARALTVRGNRVVGTSSAEGALEVIRQWPVDLILVDEGLPGMSGVEFAIRVRDHYPDIPVVLMSDEQNADNERAAELAGAVATIAKPFGPEAIVELLRSFPKSET